MTGDQALVTVVPGTMATSTAVSSQALTAWKFQLRAGPCPSDGIKNTVGGVKPRVWLALVPHYCGEKQASFPTSTLGQPSQALNIVLPIKGPACIKGSQYLSEPIET